MFWCSTYNVLWYACQLDSLFKLYRLQVSFSYVERYEWRLYGSLKVLNNGSVLSIPGYLKANPRFGAFPKVTVAIVTGYFLGKLSYQQACADKLMALPGSYIGQLLRDRRDGKIGGYVPTTYMCNGVAGIHYKKCCLSFKKLINHSNIPTWRLYY